MLTWLTSKFAFVGAFVALIVGIAMSLVKQGKQTQALKDEKETEKIKFKEQDARQEKNTEIIKAVDDVKEKNIVASDSTIINKLRSKWQRD